MRQYRIHEFVVQVEPRRLLGPGGSEVELTPRLFDALLFFVEHADELLTKERLLQTLWPGLVVEENGLNQVVSALRKALGDPPQQPRFIQTVPRRGFRFVAPVQRLDEPAAPPAADAAGAQAAPSPLPTAAAPRRRQLVAWAAGGLGVVSAAGLAWHLSRPAATAPQATTLAVLPFKPIAATDPADEPLQVGMAESLVARLSNLPGVAVRSMGSARRYAGADQDPIRAARELQVRWIVDGSVQRAEGRVRVTARLLNTDSGEAAWSGSFDESITGVFDLQDAISRQVVGVLAPHLERRGQRRLAGAGGTRNFEAYQLYLIARQQAEGVKTAGLVRSIELYRRAIALDPAYALAYAGMGESQRRMIFGADGEPAVVLAEAARHNQRAIELDPDLAAGHAGVGWVRYWHEWDWAGAEEAFARALALNPSEAGARLGYSQLLDTLGRRDEALVQLRLGRESDPLSLILLTLESGTLMATRRDEARERLQRVFEIDPAFWVAHLVQGSLHLVEGRPGEALRSMEQADRLADGSSQPAATLGWVLARQGEVDRARQLLRRLQTAAASRYVPPTSIGLIHAGLGEKEAAMAALQRAFAVKDVRMTLLTQDGRWALLRGDPRFGQLLGAMKLG